jgi:hypothetical protein
MTLDELKAAYVETFLEPLEWKGFQGPSTEIELGPIAIRFNIFGNQITPPDDEDGRWWIAVIPQSAVSPDHYDPLRPLWERRGEVEESADLAIRELSEYLTGLQAALSMTIPS